MAALRPPATFPVLDMALILSWNKKYVVDEWWGEGGEKGTSEAGFI